MLSRISIIFISILAVFSSFAQFNFQLSKSLSDNFGENLITIGEDNGKVYLFDEDKESFISHDLDSDSFIKSEEKFYKNIGLSSPEYLYSQEFFITDDYIIICFTNLKIVKGFTGSVLVVFLNKEDLTFNKKVQLDTDLLTGINNYTNQFVDFNISNNKKYILFTYNELIEKTTGIYKVGRTKGQILNIETGDYVETPLQEFLSKICDEVKEESHLNEDQKVIIIDRIKEQRLGKLKVSNNGAIYLVLNVDYQDSYSAVFLAKIEKEGNIEIFRFEGINKTLSNSIFWDDISKQLHYIDFSYSGYDDYQNSDIFDTYYYIKFDENLKIIVDEEDEGLGKDLILHANQGIDYYNIEDNSIGLISFEIIDFSVLNGFPVITFDKKIKYRNYYFDPSFLFIFLNEKGSIQSYKLIKRWNTNASRLSISKVFYSEKAVYVVSNFETRFEPFKGEKEIENSHFGFLKITPTKEVIYTDVLPFSKANYLGITYNLNSFDLSEGNLVVKFKRENKGLIPAQFKEYKFFYATVKLE